MASIKSLIDDLLRNPEKIDEVVSKLPDDQINEVMKNLVPYDVSINPSDERIMAFSYTNLREDYLTKYLTTSLVAFMYRRAEEFLIMPHKDKETKENTVAQEVVKKFLATLFEYNPDIHVQECAKVPKTPEDIQKAKAVMKMADGPDNIEVKDVGSTSVPNDTFAWFRMYQKDNFEKLRWATMVLYGVLPNVELMVQPLEVFEGKDPLEQYKIYEHMHRDALKYSLYAAEMGKWTVLGSFQSNKDKVSFLNENTEVLARILEQHKADEKIGEELLKKRIKERKKENIRREGKDSASFQDHLNSMPAEGMGAAQVLTKEEEEELVEEAKKEVETDKIAKSAADILAPFLAPNASEKPIIKEVTKVPDNIYNEDYNPPEDGLTVNVYTTDKKNGLQKSHFFTEAVNPIDEDREKEERFKALKEKEDNELKKKVEAEKIVREKLSKRGKKK